MININGKEYSLADIIAISVLLLFTTVTVICYFVGVVTEGHLARVMASECLIILIYYMK